MRLSVFLLALILGFLPMSAGAEVPQPVLEQIVQLRVDAARLLHLRDTGQLTQADLSRRSAQLKSEETNLWKPYRTLRAAERKEAEDSVEATTIARLRTLVPQWATEEQDRKAALKEQSGKGADTVDIDARKALEFQRTRLLIKQQLDAGKLTPEAFAQQDRAALEAIAKARRPYAGLGQPLADAFDHRLDLLTKALANDPTTYIPERQVLPETLTGPPEFDRDVELAKSLRRKMADIHAKLDQKLISPDTVTESDTIYQKDIARLEERYDAISAERGAAFRAAVEGRPIPVQPSVQAPPLAATGAPTQQGPSKGSDPEPASAGFFDELAYNAAVLFQFGVKFILAGGLLLAAFAGVYWLAMIPNRRKQETIRKEAADSTRALTDFGATPEERTQRIDEAFDRRVGEVGINVDTRELRCSIGRQLSAMAPREREALRIVYHLSNLGMTTNAYALRLGLVYADGKGTIFDGHWISPHKNWRNINDAVRSYASSVPTESAVSAALRDLETSTKSHPDHPILKKLSSRLFGDGNDLAPGPPLESRPRGEAARASLILGLDPTDPEKVWSFDREGSLITIAPSGKGKTQSQVFPNLLTWRGAAVVLDVKGEIYEKTSKWRSENVGPVYKFSPLDPESSHCYNPLALIRSDPDYLWEDARLLADMMIVPRTTKDPFWEDKARDILTSAIAYVCRHDDVRKRDMANVLDILHGVGWERFVDYLESRIDIRTMIRTGQSLSDMDRKTRDSVLQTAQTAMKDWAGQRIARATRTSDWQPLDLRNTPSPTVYICLKPDEIGSYTSLLRVLISQHIMGLTRTIPSRDEHPILFVLDELPCLQSMPPVEKALELGRQFGLKLWMFVQNLGQLSKLYPNAEGMVGGCAVRMYMNPSPYDRTAVKLSDEIGFRESVLDGSRVKIVEPNVLAGPDFEDSVIVMASSAKPIRLKKYFAYQDADLVRRMGSC